MSKKNSKENKFSFIHIFSIFAHTKNASAVDYYTTPIKVLYICFLRIN